MFSATVSCLLGLIAWAGAVVPIPRVLPVIGVALGVNGLIKERRRPAKRKAVMRWCVVGAVTNTVPAVLFALKGWLRI